MIIKLQSIDPESSSKEELSRGTHEYIFPLIWGQLEKIGGYQRGEMGWRERVKGSFWRGQCENPVPWKLPGIYESDPSEDFW